MESIHQRIVIKVGTSTLTAGTSSLCLPQITALARQIATVVEQVEKSHCLFGPIAVGREYLGSPALPKTIPASHAGSSAAAPDERFEQ